MLFIFNKCCLFLTNVVYFYQILFIFIKCCLFLSNVVYFYRVFYQTLFPNFLHLFSRDVRASYVTTTAYGASLRDVNSPEPAITINCRLEDHLDLLIYGHPCIFGVQRAILLWRLTANNICF